MESSEKLEIALKLGWFIKQLDEMIFGGAAEILIVEREPKPGESIAFFVPAEESKKQKDHYKILGYLSEVIPEEIKKHRHLIDLKKEWHKLPTWSEEEILIAIAAHEVRHRVQKRLNISLLSPESRANDEYLRILIELHKRISELEQKRNPREFDAKVIEWLVAKLWHDGKSLEDIAKVVKADAKDLLKG